HYVTETDLIDMDFYYDFVKTVLPTITVEEVSAKAKEWNINKNKTIAISGPSDNPTYLSENEANMIIAQMANAEGITPYEDVVVESNLIKKELAGGKITSKRAIDELGAEEWTLSNGAKILYRKADYEKDQISLIAHSKGGSSLYDIEDLPSAFMLSNLVGLYGLSEFDNITLTKMLTGKNVSYGVNLGDTYETFNGRTTPADLETLFQLLYLSFEEPRFDKEAHETFMMRQKAAIANIHSNPNNILSDSLRLIRTNYHPRTLLFNEEYLNNVDIEKVEEIYRDRFKDASDFVFIIVGNVDKETLTPLVEKYIGSIPQYNREETWRDNMVRNPKKSKREIEIPMETEKATCFTEYVQENISYSPQNSIYLQVLRKVLKLRYNENIREKEGGTYGVQVGSSASKSPYEKFTLTMSFDCERDRADYLQSLVHKETEVLVKDGPTQEELEKVVLNMQKEREQSKPHNSYWLNALYTYHLLDYNPTDPANYEDILAKITTNDVKNFAASFFNNADEIDVIFKSAKN
ncbi:MAG: insulinase family protein, partial [Odoribacter sp.]|nr:insulinase family protein [Odoribacter sp.]